jgi:hypothetical protein
MTHLNVVMVARDEMCAGEHQFELIQQIAYRDAEPSIRREIAGLQDRAYGPSGVQPEGDPAPLHDPALEPESFLLYGGRRLVSYAAVVTTTIEAGGEYFRASGLSCVATDPEFTRRGYASRIVAAATLSIAASDVDLGVFTCAPHLAPLYTAAGEWQLEPDVVLVGSRDPDALTSTRLGVVVLMRLFSTRALARSGVLRSGTIDLGLPIGQFW